VLDTFDSSDVNGVLAGVIADIKHIKKQAWQAVARQQGLAEPSEHQLTLIMDMRLERAITEVSVTLLHVLRLLSSLWLAFKCAQACSIM